MLPNEGVYNEALSSYTTVASRSRFSWKHCLLQKKKTSSNYSPSNLGKMATDIQRTNEKWIRYYHKRYIWGSPTQHTLNRLSFIRMALPSTIYKKSRKPWFCGGASFSRYICFYDKTDSFAVVALYSDFKENTPFISHFWLPDIFGSIAPLTQGAIHKGNPVCFLWAAPWTTKRFHFTLFSLFHKFIVRLSSAAYPYTYVYSNSTLRTI